MFCTQCGAKLNDDARFCPACGSPVMNCNTQGDTTENREDINQPPKNNAPRIIRNLTLTVKRFFSKEDQKITVAATTGDDTHSGILAAGVCALFYALASYANLRLNFFVSFFVAVGMYAALTMSMYVLIRFVLKKEIGFLGAASMAAYAGLPLVGVWLLSFFFAVISPLIFLLLGGIGLIATVYLAYESAYEYAGKTGGYFSFTLFFTVLFAAFGFLVGISVASAALRLASLLSAG